MRHPRGRARAVGLALFVSAALLASPHSVASEPAVPPEDPPGIDASDAADATASDDTPATAAEDEAAEDPAPSGSSSPTAAPPTDLNAGSGVRVKLICTNCNAASLWVNGLSGDHVRVSLDGMPTVGGLGTVYTLSQFPADFIASSHVTHGPGSVLSGSSAFGGTIDFHSVEPTTEAKSLLDFQIADDAFKSIKLAGADRWGPVGALVALQAAEAQNVDADSNGWPEIAEFERVTAHGIFDFHVTNNQKFTVDLLSYGEDQHQGPGGPAIDLTTFEHIKEDEATFFNMRNFGLRWQWRSPGGVNLFFGGRYSRRGHQQWQAPEYEPVTWTFLIEDEQSTGRFEAEIPLGQGLLSTGAAWSRMSLQVDQNGVPGTSQTFPIGQPRFLVDNLEQRELWIEHAQSLGSKWDISVGARADNYQVYGRQVRRERFPLPEREYSRKDPRREYDHFAPRAQAHWRPNAKFVLGLAAGLGSTGPVPVFTETCCGAKYQRSLALRPEDARSFQISGEMHPTQDMRVSVRLFRSDIDDYQQKVVYKSDGWVAYYTRVNIPRAVIQGIDLVHDMRFKDGRYNVGWTWTYTDHEGSATYATTDQNELILDDVTGEPFLVAKDGADLAYIPRNAGSAYLRYDHLQRGTKINFNWTYQGSLEHFQLSENIRPDTAPWPMLKAESHWTADVDFEQRLGAKGWAVYGGVRNINNYYQDDLGSMDRIYDWGPIQGRTGFVGMKFSR